MLRSGPRLTRGRGGGSRTSKTCAAGSPSARRDGRAGDKSSDSHDTPRSCVGDDPRMGSALAFAVTAAFNPTLLTATLAMMFATEPRRLMSGYLAGAYTVSISIGLVIVFALRGTSAASTTQHTLSPALDVVF